MTCEAGLGFCLRLFIVLSGCGFYDLVAVVVHGEAFGCWGGVCFFGSAKLCPALALVLGLQSVGVHTSHLGPPWGPWVGIICSQDDPHAY